MFQKQRPKDRKGRGLTLDDSYDAGIMSSLRLGLVAAPSVLSGLELLLVNREDAGEHQVETAIGGNG